MSTTAPAPGHTGPSEPPEPPAELLHARRAHPRPIRWMHWLNVPLLVVMAWSGLRIYWANDIHAVGIGEWEMFAFFPDGFYSLLGLNQRLARGIAFHLGFGWLLVANGLAYLLYLACSGAWRRIVPDRGDLRDLGPTVAHDLGLRSAGPPRGRYNAAQKVAYTVVALLGILIVATGFAIYKPVQLAPLTALLGGYRTARLLHFWSFMALSAFTLVHLVQVVRAGRANVMSMVTGFTYTRVGQDPAAEEGPR